MNYEEAMAFLEDTKKYGSQLGLESIRNLMHELGDVQEQVPAVHIGGTNGKGSVGAMLSAVLSEAGYRVGRFATPDVFAYEEEFLMNGKPVTKERLAQLFTDVSEACQKLTAKGLPHPTRFEVETAAAFLWFFEEDCDLALVEVGMGGATDATNLITRPLVSLLTSVSMDHMQFLGNTLREIAQVKAGIIKKGCPVVTVAQKPEVMEVIRQTAGEKQARLIVAEFSQAEDVVYTPEGSSFSVRGDGAGSSLPVELGIPGSWQVENALCALKTLEILAGKYPKITRGTVQAGLKEARWPGRLEQISSDPVFFLDGAHNEDAVRKLRFSFDAIFPERTVVYIMGVLADKDYSGMIRQMFRSGDRVFTVTPPNPRGLPAEALAAALQNCGVSAVPCESSAEAVRHAVAEAGREDVILAFGSLSYLKGIREQFSLTRSFQREGAAAGVRKYGADLRGEKTV